MARLTTTPSLALSLLLLCYLVTSALAIPHSVRGIANGFLGVPEARRGLWNEYRRGGGEVQRRDLQKRGTTTLTLHYFPTTELFIKTVSTRSVVEKTATTWITMVAAVSTDLQLTSLAIPVRTYTRTTTVFLEITKHINDRRYRMGGEKRQETSQFTEWVTVTTAFQSTSTTTKYTTTVTRTVNTVTAKTTPSLTPISGVRNPDHLWTQIKWVVVTVTTTPTHNPFDDENSGINLGVVVGGTVSAIAAIAALFGVCVIARYRGKKKEKEKRRRREETTGSAGGGSYERVQEHADEELHGPENQHLMGGAPVTPIAPGTFYDNISATPMQSRFAPRIPPSLPMFSPPINSETSYPPPPNPTFSGGGDGGERPRTPTVVPPGSPPPPPPPLAHPTEYHRHRHHSESLSGNIMPPPLAEYTAIISHPGPDSDVSSQSTVQPGDISDTGISRESSAVHSNSWAGRYGAPIKRKQVPPRGSTESPEEWLLSQQAIKQQEDQGQQEQQEQQEHQGQEPRSSYEW